MQPRPWDTLGGVPRTLRHAVAVLSCVLLPLSLGGCGDDEPSDEDLLEQFVKDVSGHVDEAYVERALSYIEPARYPLDVAVPQHSGVYDAESAPKIVEHFRQTMLGRFRGDDVKVPRHHIDIKGDRATVKMTMRTRISPLRAEVDLQKREKGVWKVTRVHVEPSSGFGGF